MQQSYLVYFLQLIKAILLLSFVFSFSRFYGFATGDGGQLSLMGSFGFAVFGMITMTMLYAAPALIAAFAYRYFYKQRIIAAVLSFALFALYHMVLIRHLSPEFKSLSEHYPNLFWLFFLAIIGLSEFFNWRAESKST